MNGVSQVSANFAAFEGLGKSSLDARRASNESIQAGVDTSSVESAAATSGLDARKSGNESAISSTRSFQISAQTAAQGELDVEA